LAECGWFEELPKAHTERLRAGLSRRGKDPWKKLAVVDLDPECIYDPGDYSELLNEFARASGGAFAPEDVREVWKDEKADLSFRHRGKVYRKILQVDSDYVDDGFLSLIRRAMTDAGGPLRFLPLRGMDLAFALTTPAAFKKAEARGLIPSGRSEAAEARRAEEQRERRFQDPRTLLFTKDGGRFVVACGSKVWVMETESLRLLQVHPGEYRLEDAALIDDGRLVFGIDSAVKEMDLASGRIRPLGRAGAREYVRQVRVSPDGKDLFFGAYSDGAVLLSASLATRKCVEVGRLPSALMSDLQISPDGSVLALAGGDAGLSFWNRRRPSDHSTARPLPWVGSVDWHPGGKRLAVCGTKKILVVGYPGGRTVAECAYSYTAQTMPERVTFSPDGKTLATWAASDGGFTLWDATTGRNLGSVRPHTDTSKVNSLAFTPSGAQVATVGLRGDGTQGSEVAFTDVASKQVVARTSGRADST
jgi:hypothetical protein